MSYDPFADLEDAPAHDDFTYKVLLDPHRSKSAKTNRNEMKAEMENIEIGWVSKKSEKRAKRQRLNQEGDSGSNAKDVGGSDLTRSAKQGDDDPMIQ